MALNFKGLNQDQLVATLVAHKPNWESNWSLIKGYDGDDLYLLSRMDLKELLGVAPALWLYSHLHGSQAGDIGGLSEDPGQANVSHAIPSPIFLYYATIQQLDRICNKELAVDEQGHQLSVDESESFRRSCAAEIGRRVVQQVTLQILNKKPTTIPQLSEWTKRAMKEEGWDLDQFK